MANATHFAITARSRATHTTEKLYATAYKALGDGDSECAQRTFMLMAGTAPFDARAWVGLGASLEQQGKVATSPRSLRFGSRGSAFVAVLQAG